MRHILFIYAFLFSATSLFAQDVMQIDFCDKRYEYGVGKDSITLYLRVLDSDLNRSKDVKAKDLEQFLNVSEDNVMIPTERRTIRSLSSGKRIPDTYTFSVLVDLGIPNSGKEQIYKVVNQLIESAPDSSVYISFFGDEISPSRLITKENFGSLKKEFHESATSKFFYSALYAKLQEFGPNGADNNLQIEALSKGYLNNSAIVKRAKVNKDKNLLFIFVDGSKEPTHESVEYYHVTDYQKDLSHIVPKVYAFYFSGNGLNEDVDLTLEGVTGPRSKDGKYIQDRKGKYLPTDDINKIISEFEQVVQNAMYDFAYTYKATDDKSYSGNVNYQATWGNQKIGEGIFSIGSPENPWPTQPENFLMQFVVAVFVTLLTLAIFFCVMKILVPYLKSKFFAAKYYQKYVQEANVQRRICHYCKQDIQPGQMIVAKCKHIMHVHCWVQNGYKCSEFGQNCNTGIQEHVEWNELMSMHSLRDCYQMFAGALAGFVSWIVYELTGRGGFNGLASGIVNTFFTNEEQVKNLYDTCVLKVSAFMTIGLLLGFFLSIIFRYNDEYRNKDLKVYLKIVGLSILSGIIGMMAFAFGGILFCLLLSIINTTYIPWFCSLPAYLLYSICMTLSLTIKSTIPVKSAVLGGVASAIIGFIVLYISSASSSKYGWMNMLLDFIIYGGGLGASLVTVRMLAEKYFLVILNGVKAGQKIPIHKWMNATGGGNKVSIGMTGECEIQMNWEKTNKVAKEHVQLYIDHTRMLPVVKPLATGVIYNARVELPVGKPSVLSNGDTIKIGDTTFQYVETD